MHSTFVTCVPTLLLGVASVLAAPLTPDEAIASDSVYVTPHDRYSSSVGVLGCKIDTNRVAYWPGSVDCTNICIEVSYAGRSVKLLRVDQSGGAFDISYDAWNILVTGESARTHPVPGGGIAATYVNLPMSECVAAGLVHGGKLAFTGANSMNFLAACHAQPGSWVANNYVIYNIYNPTCTLGYDEVCTLDWATQNQATCPHQLGAMPPLTSQPVVDIIYPSGQEAVAP
ncbi:hypothetical protein GE09DRAFT_1272259 [Coniochaeta sp. 2T2.1]|nr:hypothetical protein GE09DRAFT_1272259 [Coniochaeta sp. 2T2.1]